MNVGRNYNGPKVLGLSQEGFRRTGTVWIRNKQLNEVNYTKAISSYSNVRMVLKKHMAICWEICNLQMISREVAEM